MTDVNIATKRVAAIPSTLHWAEVLWYLAGGNFSLPVRRGRSKKSPSVQTKVDWSGGVQPWKRPAKSRDALAFPGCHGWGTPRLCEDLPTAKQKICLVGFASGSRMQDGKQLTKPSAQKCSALSGVSRIQTSPGPDSSGFCGSSVSRSAKNSFTHGKQTDCDGAYF